MIKNYELYKLSKKVLNEGSITLLDSNSVCSKSTCKKCIFSSYNNPRCKFCGSDTEEYYKEVAKSYIKFYEDFEPVDEVALEELDEILEEAKNDFSKCESKLMNNAKKKENVKMGMSLKERILNKLDYRSIAEQIYDRLEKEIIDDVVCYIDEDQIVEDMIYGYKSNYLEVAREVVAESIAEDIDANEIEDHFKEVVQEKVDDM